MNDWISVADELPLGGQVLICYLEPFFGGMIKEIGVGYYDSPDNYDGGEGGGWKFWLSDAPVVGGGVTHWMRLPIKPEIGGQ